MSRIEPDAMMWPDEDTGAVDEVREPAFRRSTILAAIDEEVAFWAEHPNADDAHPGYVLRSLRARFQPEGGNDHE